MAMRLICWSIEQMTKRSPEAMGGLAMLEHVHVGIASADCYERIVGVAATAQLRALAGSLRGVRVLHVNATPYGGGVAEILFSEIPLLRDLGIAADWGIIAGDADFFHVTKHIHN